MDVNPLRVLGWLVRQGQTQFLEESQSDRGSCNTQGSALFKAERVRKLECDVALDQGVVTEGPIFRLESIARMSKSSNVVAFLQGGFDLRADF